MYDSEHLLRLKLESALDSCYNKCYQLVEDLNKKPTEVVKTNWGTVGIFSTLTAILTSLIYYLIK